MVKLGLCWKTTLRARPRLPEIAWPNSGDWTRSAKMRRRLCALASMHERTHVFVRWGYPRSQSSDCYNNHNICRVVCVVADNVLILP